MWVTVRRFFLLWLLTFLLAGQGFGQVSLENLVNFRAKFDNVTKFLADQEAVIRYRDMYKEFAGYDDGFDMIYDKQIEQLKILLKDSPELANAFWQSQTPEDQGFKIETSSIERSGIEGRLEQKEQLLEEYREKLRKEASKYYEEDDLSKRNEKLKAGLRYIRAQIKAVEVKYDDEIVEFGSLSKTKQKEFLLKIRKRKKTFHEARNEYRKEIQKLIQANKDELTSIVAYLKHELTGKEEWLDSYRISFVEESMIAVDSIASLRSAEIEEVDIEKLLVKILGDNEALPFDVFAHFKKEDYLYITSQQLLEKAQANLKRIAKLATPKRPARVNEALQALSVEHPEISELNYPSMLDDEIKAKHDEWEKKRRDVYQAKQLLVQEVSDTGLKLPIIDIDYEGNIMDAFSIELIQQNNKTVEFKAMDSFEGLFTGRHVNSCVAGKNCDDITPRRWALSALEDVRSFAVFQEGKFDGVLRIVPISYQDNTGVSVVYEALDLTIKSIKSTIEISLISSGKKKQIEKYSFFDAIVDNLKLSEGAEAFVVGDGNVVKSNTGAAKAVDNSASVFEAKSFPVQIDNQVRLSLVDSHTEALIVKSFDGGGRFDYNSGRMIYEGGVDSENLRLVTPKQNRRKYSKEELEVILFKSIIKGESLSGHRAWVLAIESGVKLNKDLKYYRNNLKANGRFLKVVWDMVYNGDEEEKKLIFGLIHKQEPPFDIVFKKHLLTVGNLEEFVLKANNAVKLNELVNPASKNLNNLAQEFFTWSLKEHPELASEFPDEYKALMIRSDLSQVAQSNLAWALRLNPVLADNFPHEFVALMSRADLSLNAQAYFSFAIREHQELTSKLTDGYKALMIRADLSDSAQEHFALALKEQPELADKFPSEFHGLMTRADLSSNVQYHFVRALREHPELASKLTDGYKAIMASDNLSEYAKEEFALALKYHPILADKLAYRYKAIMASANLSEKAQLDFALALKEHPELAGKLAAGYKKLMKKANLSKKVQENFALRLKENPKLAGKLADGYKAIMIRSDLSKKAQEDFARVLGSNPRLAKKFSKEFNALMARGDLSIKAQAIFAAALAEHPELADRLPKGFQALMARDSLDRKAQLNFSFALNRHPGLADKLPKGFNTLMTRADISGSAKKIYSKLLNEHPELANKIGVYINDKGLVERIVRNCTDNIDSLILIIGGGLATKILLDEAVINESSSPGKNGH